MFIQSYKKQKNRNSELDTPTPWISSSDYTHTHTHTHIYIYIEYRSKCFNPYSEKRAIAKSFCCDNTQPLFITFEKSELMFIGLQELP